MKLFLNVQTQNNSSSIFSQTINNPYVQKNDKKFFKLTKLQQTQQLKRDILSFLPSLLIELVFFIELAF